MPVINRVAEFQREIAEWRQDFHRNPELQYDVQRTAGRVAELLQSFGLDEVVTGIGRTGVVGVIKGRNGGDGRVIGLRADKWLKLSFPIFPWLLPLLVLAGIIYKIIKETGPDK